MTAIGRKRTSLRQRAITAWVETAASYLALRFTDTALHVRVDA
jgi:hypothetical protein